jgi:hypothetical protein
LHKHVCEYDQIEYSIRCTQIVEQQTKGKSGTTKCVERLVTITNLDSDVHL